MLSGCTGSGVGRNRIRCLIVRTEQVHEPADQRLSAFACGLDDGLGCISVLAPSALFEQWETFRAVTPGRRARSARLLVGSAPSG